MAKKMELNEQESNSNKQIFHLEKSLALSEEKISSLELRVHELKEKHNKDLASFTNNQNDKIIEKLNKEKDILEKQIENLKEQISQLSQSLMDAKNTIEKEKLLYENKYQFLENQINAYKKDQNESSYKYQEFLSQIQIKSKQDLEKMENNYKSLLNNLEINYTNKIEEHNKLKQLEINHFQSTIKDLNEQIKTKDSIHKNLQLEKDSLLKNNKIKEYENELNGMQAEIERIKINYDSKIQEIMSKSESEKDLYKKKIADLEKRMIDAESNKGFGLIEYEKERSQWGFEMDKLNKANSELEDEVLILKNKIKLLNKEIEKLKLTSSVYTSTTNNIRKGVSPFSKDGKIGVFSINLPNTNNSNQNINTNISLNSGRESFQKNTVNSNNNIQISKNVSKGNSNFNLNSKFDFKYGAKGKMHELIGNMGIDDLDDLDNLDDIEEQ